METRLLCSIEAEYCQPSPPPPPPRIFMDVQCSYMCIIRCSPVGPCCLMLFACNCLNFEILLAQTCLARQCIQWYTWYSYCWWCVNVFTLVLNVERREDFIQLLCSLWFAVYLLVPAVIHIPALEYRDFRARLPHVRIVNVRGIVVQQTISERFAGAFIEQVDRNQTYRLPAGTVSGNEDTV